MSLLDQDKLNTLRQQALNSTVQCEAIAQEAEKKITLLEETRRLYQDLEEDLKFLNL